MSKLVWHDQGDEYFVAQTTMWQFTVYFSEYRGDYMLGQIGPGIARNGQVNSIEEGKKLAQKAYDAWSAAKKSDPPSS